MTDIVAILDSQNFRVLFDGASPMRVTVRETSKMTSFTVEDGTERSDHRVIDPVEIDLSVLLTDQTRTVFEELRSLFLSGIPLIVQTKVRSYPDMVIIEMPHDETPDQGESIPVSVRLKQLRTITPEYGALPPRSVANRNQSSTVKRGSQQTEEATTAETRKASTLYRIVA